MDETALTHLPMSESNGGGAPSTKTRKATAKQPKSALTKMAVQEALGKMILLLNPYTKGEEGIIAFGHGSPGDDIDINEVRVEVDDYEGHWAFRGIDQKIKRAVRIEYRYLADGQAGANGVMTTEHLLVGFAGSGGGE